MIPVCALRDAGLFNNAMTFQDEYMNNFSIKERAVLINTLRAVIAKKTPERFLTEYTAESIFPYGPLVMLVRDNKEKLDELRKKYP